MAAKRKPKVKVVCANEACGRTFEVMYWRSKRARFCSRKCSASSFKKPMTYDVCEQCNTKRERLPSQAKRRFCGQKCFKAYRAEHPEEFSSRRTDGCCRIPGGGICDCGNLTLEPNGVCLTCKFEIARAA